MEPLILAALLAQCAPLVHPQTAAALIATESAANPHAIGVVGGSLQRQPRSRSEALATAAALEANGWNYSVGLGQINRKNFAALGLTVDEAFDPCTNLTAMQTLLIDCYQRSAGTSAGSQTAHASPGANGPAAEPAEAVTPKAAPAQAFVRRALSCYYSGNFVTGFRHGYVARVVRSATTLAARPP
jgi:type IV secretion system protein VirB1